MIPAEPCPVCGKEMTVRMSGLSSNEKGILAIDVTWLCKGYSPAHTVEIERRYKI